MIYISIGSNMGNRINYLYQAVDSLKQRYLKNIRGSIILETECLLPPGAPQEWNKPFLNMIVAGDSDLSPDALLQGLKEIERELGRPESYERWSPRVIDLDILLWDDRVLDLPQLKIPHPELENRPFLLHLLATMGVPYKKPQTVKNCFLRSFAISPRFVGVVNVTPDSFSEDGFYNAIDKATHLAEEGASIVEIGAQSTRLGATLQSPEEEYSKLQPVFEGLKPLMEDQKITIGIDTFSPIVIQKILKDYPISWINDVTGNLDKATLEVILEHNCTLVTMHSLGIPPKTDSILSQDIPPIDSILDWAQKKKEYLLNLGFKKESVVIDPGIGFGKIAYQSIEILRHLENLKVLGLPLLIGHSRKHFMKAFSTQEAKNRDLETIAISALLEHKADFLRIHNVADHMRFFVAQHTLKGGYPAGS